MPYGESFVFGEVPLVERDTEVSILLSKADAELVRDLVQEVTAAFLAQKDNRHALRKTHLDRAYSIGQLLTGSLIDTNVISVHDPKR